MPKKLSESQILQFQEKGFVFPIDMCSQAQASHYLDQLESFEQSQGKTMGKGFNFKPHLLLTWVNEIARNPIVLDAVEDLIGPNIRLFHLSAWSKGPGDGAFVDWHQDATYFGLDPSSQITVWVALSDASVEAGCMEVIPESHKLGQLHHGQNDHNKILLSRGQTVDVPIDTSNTQHMPLRAGQFSMHDTFLLHCSGPNLTSHRRVGLGFSYIPTQSRCTSAVRLTAALVRGVDHFNYYDDEPQPMIDNGFSEQKFHADAVARFKLSNDEQAAKY